MTVAARTLNRDGQGENEGNLVNCKARAVNVEFWMRVL
jgi:hypothetical protein